MATPSRFSLLSGPGTPRNRRRNPLWRFRRFLFLLALFGLGTVIAAVAVLSQEKLEPLNDLSSYSQTSYLCTAEVVAGCNADNATAQFSAGEDRVIVSYEQIPRVMIDAVVATEDGDFFTHRGVDPYGIARALYRDLRNEGVTQGASTITQQLVKIELLSNERSITRKLKEATLAIKLERELEKEEILTRYLNIVYFGRGAYGLQSAAQAYFGKDVEELDLADAALLAGLLRAPSTADPVGAPEEATRRRSTTLRLMVEDELITQGQADEADRSGFGNVLAAPRREGLGPVKGIGTEYFVEAVRQQLTGIEGLPEGAAYTNGLRIYTTLDQRLQTAAYNTVVEEGLGEGDAPAASIVAVDERGFVRAMMAGRDFGTSQVNLALGRDGGGSGRQPGSAFKPFVLAEALEQNFSAKSFFSAPTVIEIPGADNGGTWTVRGGGSSDGYRDLIDALRVSSNVVYAQLMVEVGPSSVVELANRLGISAQLEPVNALVLGSGEVSVLDMAAAYSSFENQGIKYEPILIERIEQADGTVICWYPVNGVCARNEGREGEPVLDASIANQVTFAMEQVVKSGTARGVSEILGNVPAAGKTGTTSDAKDAWFVGYTCDLTAAVWMGFVGAPGQPVRSMQNILGVDEIHGGDFPADMWAKFMTKARQIGDPELTPECAGFPAVGSFPGIQLNPELSTTTLPPCADLGPPETVVVGDGADGTLVDTVPTATTEPCEPPETVPSDSTTTLIDDSTTSASAGESTTTVVGSTTVPSTTTPSVTATPTTVPTTAPSTAPSSIPPESVVPAASG